MNPPAEATTAMRSDRLCRHGLALFLLGLLTGFVIPLTENPRMALSAHLEAVLNALVLLAIGMLLPRLRLAARRQRLLVGLLLYGTYANWGATLLAAVFGTGRSTPIAGAGHAAEPWQEALVAGGLYSLSLAMVVATGLAMHGLRAATRSSAQK